MAETDVELPLEDGPWDGMLDSLSPTTKRPGRYLLGQNVYPLDPDLGDSVVGRPGVRQLGAQLGAGALRRVQGIFQFTKTTGFTRTVAVVGGRFYTFDWSVALWTESLSTAQLAAAGIVIDPFTQVAFLNFSDRLVVSDGVHKLWDWDGTTGAGLRFLANSEPIYGQPVVYYARVVGIVALEPDTIIWCQTDDATLGYRSGGFNNAWSPTQNDPDRLYGLLATNSRLYAFRARSALPLDGPPGPDFSTDNTRDSISDTFGTLSPFAAILHDVNAVVIDADLHPQFLRPGGAGFIPIWKEFRETTKRISKQPLQAAKCQTIYYSPAGLYLMAYPDSGALECNALLVYDGTGDLPKPLAVWRGWEMTAIAMVEDLSGAPRFLHGDTNGNIIEHGNPEDDNFLLNDELPAGTVAIEHILQQQPQGYSTKREKIFDRLDLTTRTLTTQTLNVSFITPLGASAEQQIVLGSGAAGFDVGVFDTLLFDASGGGTLELHGDVGLESEGRWGMAKVRHAALDEFFSLNAMTVLAYPVNDDPEVP